MWSGNFPEERDYPNNSLPAYPARRDDGMKRQMTQQSFSSQNLIAVIAESYRNIFS
jgi:hypothetical protein